DGVEARLKIHIYHLVPHSLRHPQQEIVLRDASIVDQYMKASEIGDDGVDKLFGLKEVACIAAVPFRLDTLCREFLLQRHTLFHTLQIGKRDVGAIRCETQCNSSTYSFRVSRDEGIFSFK